MFMLLPEKQFIEFQPPKPTLPRAEEHHIEWIKACKGGPRTEADFGYAATLTEGLLVGFLALRTGRRIEWDATSMTATGCPEADAFHQTGLSERVEAMSDRVRVGLVGSQFITSSPRRGAQGLSDRRVVRGGLAHAGQRGGVRPRPRDSAS